SPNFMVCPPSEVRVGKYRVVCAPGCGHRRHVLAQDIKLLASFRAPLPLPPVFDHPLEPCGAWPSPASRATYTVTPCRVATAPILQQSPTLLILVNVDVAVLVDLDGMPSVLSARCGRARPAVQHLPIKRQQANQGIQLR